MQALGLLGGTFDPVHHGHLRVALELVDLLTLDEVRLVPVGVPAHRDPPVANATQRLQMLEAALCDVDRLDFDAREIEREGPSFTVDTLASVRSDYPHASVTLIIGMDQFKVLHHWHRWREIPELAHICVVQRPGVSTTPSPELSQMLLERQVTDPGRLREAQAGYIYMGNVPVLDISSTRIRALIARRSTPRFLLTDNVIDIINQERLYANTD